MPRRLHLCRRSTRRTVSRVISWLWSQFGFSDYMMDLFRVLVREFVRV